MNPQWLYIWLSLYLLEQTDLLLLPISCFKSYLFIRCCALCYVLAYPVVSRTLRAVSFVTGCLGNCGSHWSCHPWFSVFYIHGHIINLSSFSFLVSQLLLTVHFNTISVTICWKWHRKGSLFPILEYSVYVLVFYRMVLQLFSSFKAAFFHSLIAICNLCLMKTGSFMVGIVF